MAKLPPNTLVRDFGYPTDHPLHSDQNLDPEDGAYYLGEEYSDEDEEENEDGNNLNASLVRERGEESDGFGAEEINKKAVALFDFEPENDNEVKLREGQAIWILYRHGQGWLVAEDPETGDNGLVPEEYVEIWEDEVVEEEQDIGDEPKRFLPEILGYGDDEKKHHQVADSDGEWETEEE